LNAPKHGDIGWATLNPQLGHEQAGRRPVLVLSNSRYNYLTGLIIVCPITNQAKGYPTEVSMHSGMTTTGVVLAGQVRTLDWKERQFEFLEVAPKQLVHDVQLLLETIFEEDEQDR
jgi:mRNA interferase MazF